jgi:hypothetical protein
LISLRVAVAVDGRSAEIAAARALPQPGGAEERLDRIERALAEFARRVGEVEGMLALALSRP